jgi:DUF4097 and DUF4098 domain-containing protein YvlB
MPTFSTPNPIDVAIKLPVGRLEIIASDRSDAVVTVTPTDPARAADVRGAEGTEVTFEDGRLTIKGPRPRFTVTGPSESIEVLVELPSGSRVTAECSAGGVRTKGALGATRIKNSAGAVDLEATGDVWLKVGHGSVTVGAIDGEADITASHGQVTLGSVSGGGSVNASHGSVSIGQASGAVEAKLSYGDLHIAKAIGDVTAKTAYGAIVVDDVSRGSVDVETSFGEISLGVRSGTPAWLDLSTKRGRVRNELDAGSAPAADSDSVTVRARTQFGDITVRRAQ